MATVIATVANVSVVNGTADAESEAEVDCCYSGLERILVPVIFCFVVLFGCIGNLLVVVVVIKNREQYATTTNIFILNLAIADLFFLTFCVPFHAVIYTIPEWPFGEFLCRFVHLVQYSSMVTSILTLVAMSLDRFLAVGYPIHTKHLRTPRTALAVCIVIWLTAIVMGVPCSIVYTVHVYEYPGYDPFSVCADDWEAFPGHRPTYYLVLFVVAYLLPVLLISAFSALTINRLWSMESTDGPSQRRSVKAKRRVTRLIGVVVTAFALSWLPSHVVWLWTNYFSSSWSHSYPFFYGRIAAHVLSYANSCMNPIIYAFMSSKFRRGFQRALCCKGRSRSGALSLDHRLSTVHRSMSRPPSNDDAL